MCNQKHCTSCARSKCTGAVGLRLGGSEGVVCWDVGQPAPSSFTCSRSQPLLLYDQQTCQKPTHLPIHIADSSPTATPARLVPPCLLSSCCGLREVCAASTAASRPASSEQHQPMEPCCTPWTQSPTGSTSTQHHKAAEHQAALLQQRLCGSSRGHRGGAAHSSSCVQCERGAAAAGATDAVGGINPAVQ